MRISSLAVGVFALASIVACKPAAPPQMNMPPPNVTVAKPEPRKIVEWDEYSGRLEAKESVEIRARVSGWLDSIHFKEGSTVREGDLLFTIDPRPYKMSADRAQAEMLRAENRETQTRNEFERVRKLVQSRAISEEDFDTRGKAFAEAQAAAQAAKAALEMANLDLAFTEVRAPISGRVSRALVTKGNLVSGGMAGAGATILTTIVSTSPVYLYVDVDEAASLRYRRQITAPDKSEGIPCEMAVGDESGWPHKGRIDFVDNRVDPNTGTTRARGVFETKDGILGPGFFARLRVPRGEGQSALLVPESCIGTDQANRFVFTVNAKGIAEVRLIKPGPLVDGMRVMREGLTGDEDVIVNGQARVRPGIPVNVERGTK